MEAAGEYPAEISMGLTEILLIILGVLAFVGSFIIPENLSKDNAKIEIPEEKIKALVAQEIKQAAFQIEEKTEETISAAAEKTERCMERLSNEKIMAIQEYSDTVLSQINKNHEEAVFLYDMLNNKHVQVKNTVAEINNKMQDVKAGIELGVQESVSETNTEVAAEDFERVGMRSLTDELLKKESDVTMAEEDKTKTKRAATKRKTPAKKTIAKKTEDEKKNPEIEKVSETDSEVGNNKNKILKLHEEGKSNIEIAKSLGMGIGEVKLVIGLFENGE